MRQLPSNELNFLRPADSKDPQRPFGNTHQELALIRTQHDMIVNIVTVELIIVANHENVKSVGLVALASQSTLATYPTIHTTVNQLTKLTRAPQKP